MHKVTVLGRDDQGDERAASQVRITAKGLSVLEALVVLPKIREPTAKYQFYI